MMLTYPESTEKAAARQTVGMMLRNVLPQEVRKCITWSDTELQHKGLLITLLGVIVLSQGSIERGN